MCARGTMACLPTLPSHTCTRTHAGRHTYTDGLFLIFPNEISFGIVWLISADRNWTVGRTGFSWQGMVLWGIFVVRVEITGEDLFRVNESDLYGVIDQCC